MINWACILHKQCRYWKSTEMLNWWSKSYMWWIGFEIFFILNLLANVLDMHKTSPFLWMFHKHWKKDVMQFHVITHFIQKNIWETEVILNLVILVLRLQQCQVNISPTINWKSNIKLWCSCYCSLSCAYL